MRYPKASLPILCVLLWVAVPASSASDADQPGSVLAGERLDPADYGPGVVESMEVVIARDQARSRDAVSDPKARNGRQGVWMVPSPRATYHPHSGKHNAVNKWGDTRMGIGFPDVVDIEGAWFAGQGGGVAVWTPGIRVLGYRDGNLVQTAEWFHDIGDEPKWFAMNLAGVDRIVIEAQSAYHGAGWYAMDDLTYGVTAEPGSKPKAPIVLDFEDCAFGQKLTGSDYAGLAWEEGTGDYLGEQRGIPAPQTLPDDEDAAPADGAGTGDPHGRMMGTLPSIDSEFEGVTRGDVGQFSYPPDTCGAVGPNHFVETVNTNLAVFLKSNGQRVVDTSLSSFLPGSSGDPRVLFDQHSGRWVVTIPDFNTTIYLAVSVTDDPTGSWFKTSYLASQGGDASCWSDYPTLGVDDEGIYVAAWMVGCGLTVWAVDKAPLIDPSPSLGSITAFRGMTVETTQPVHTYGAPDYQYFVARESGNRIRLRRLSGPLTSPTLMTVSSVTIPNHSPPPDVPALGSTVPLDSVDSRLMNAVYRDGYIWTAHAINWSGRAACRWYKIDPATSQLVDYGLVADISLHYFFPSITVNAGGDVLMAFSGSHGGQYAACYYTGRLYDNPPGQMAVPALLKEGETTQNNIDGYGRNRWGDYSLCSLDPTDEDTMWTIQEYAGSPTNRWGTWIAELTFGDRTAPSPNPMTWEVPPTPISTSEVSMTATEASDVESPPVEYFFLQWPGPGSGGDTRQYEPSRSYSDFGLDTNMIYTYSTRARDSSDPRNYTDESQPVTVATHIETPTGVSFGTITDTSIQVTAEGSFTRLTGNLFEQPPNQSGIFFEMTPAEGTGANQWVQAQTITVTDLSPATVYTFSVKARNYLGEDETPLVGPVAQSTTGAAPCALLGDLNGDGNVLGDDIAGFIRAKLGQAPEPGENPICADYGGTVPEDIAAFVADLVAP